MSFSLATSIPSTPLALLATAAVALTVPATVFNMFWGTNKLPVDGRLVVITGGSQGMGLSVAKVLAQKGANVAIIARDTQKLAAALAEISAAAQRPSQRFVAVSADLTSSGECRRALGEIAAWGGVPDVVWTCAGAAIPGYFKDMDADVLEQQVRTNYFSAMHTAHAAINMMAAHPPPAPGTPQRHIVFTSTVMAFYTIAGYNAYSPAKAAIRALADGLRQECLLYDIDVHCCFPGTIYSPGFEVEQLTKPELTKILEGSDEGQTPDVVAQVCVSRLEKGQSLVVTSFLGEAMRAASWGGSPRGCWWFDTVMAWVCALVWLVVGKMMDGDVRKYVKKHGVPVKGAKGTKGIGGPEERTAMFL